MDDSLSFTDYLLGGGHEDFAKDVDRRQWARARTAVEKSLRSLGDRRQAWLRDFAASVSFSGSEAEFVERIIAYTVMEGVSLDSESGAFRKNPQAPTTPSTTDPAVLKILEEQGVLIKSLTSQLQAFSEAPTKGQVQTPPLSFQAIAETELRTNNPQWVSSALFLFTTFLRDRKPDVNAARMVPEMTDAELKGILLDLSAEEKKDNTPWSQQTPPESGGDASMQDLAAIPDRFVGFVEAMWVLVATATETYKERYEGSNQSSSSSRSRLEAEIRDDEGLTEAGKRLKRVMRKRFKYVDGVEYFEIHKGEWIKTSEDPVGPCKTCRGRGEIVRHWVWRCPHLE